MVVEALAKPPVPGLSSRVIFIVIKDRNATRTVSLAQIQAPTNAQKQHWNAPPSIGADAKVFCRSVVQPAPEQPLLC
jgi:hypothetical protein